MATTIAESQEYSNHFVVNLIASLDDGEREALARAFRRVCRRADPRAGEGGPDPKSRTVIREATAELIALVNDDRDRRHWNNVRSWAAVLLGATGSPEARRALLQRLNGDEEAGVAEEENDVVLKWIVRALVDDFDSPPPMDALRVRYRREQDGIILGRWSIAQPVAARVQRCGLPGVEILLEAVRDRYLEVRRPGVRGLHRAATAGMLRTEPGGEAAGDEPAARLRRVAQERLLQVLGSHGDASTSQPWVVDLDRRLERREAAEALGELGDAEAVRKLALAAGSSERTLSVRRAATRALGRIGRRYRAAASHDPDADPIGGVVRQVVDTLHGLLASDAPSVSLAATEALCDVLDDDRAMRGIVERTLQGGAGSGQPLDVVPAADALRRIDPRKAARMIRRRIDRLRSGGEDEADAPGLPDDERRERTDQALHLLTQIGGEAALEVYRDAQNHMNEVRRQAQNLQDATISQAHKAADISLWASRVLLWGGGLLLLGVVIALVGPVGTDGSAGAIWGLGGLGTAGVASLVASFYSTPLERIERSVDNLIRTQVAFVGFLHQVSYARAELDRRFIEGRLELDDMETLLAHLRTAMGSVESLVGPPGEEPRGGPVERPERAEAEAEPREARG